jgi:hypothetical protein
MSLTTGHRNVGIGTNSLYEVINGAYNVGIGFEALNAPRGLANPTVSETMQVAIGAHSGKYTAGSGDGLVAIGHSTIAHTYGTAVGYEAEARGYYSTALGYRAIALADFEMALGTASTAVKILGTLTVAGVPITSRIADLEARLTAIGA